MEEFAPLMMLGVRVRMVRELDEGAIWCHESCVLIVDEALTRDEREDITGQMMDKLLDSEEIAAP